MRRTKVNSTLGTVVEITVLALLLLAGSAGAVKEIDNCTNITAPGEYKLNTSIINGSVDSCINITSSNVIFDGAGYTIDGAKARMAAGVFVYDPSNYFTNVTVKNLKVTNWFAGILLRIQNGNITNNTASSNAVGIDLSGSNNKLTGNTASGNGIYGINLNSDSNNNSITTNNASYNEGGIRLRRSNDTVIADNTGLKNNYTGIQLESSDRNKIRGNTVSGNNIGIYLYVSSTNTVDNNKITDNTADGIHILGVTVMMSHNNITGNNISNNLGHGIYIEKEGGTLIDRNKITHNNDSGIYLNISLTNTISNNNVSYNNQLKRYSNAGLYLVSSDSNTFMKNYVSNNPIFGVDLESSFNNSFTDNDIVYNCGGNSGVILSNSNYSKFSGNNISYNTGIGIQVYFSSYINFSNNTIKSNILTGILLHSSNNNTIYNNYFFNNTPNAWDIGNNTWNITKTNGTNIIGGPYLGGNFWSDYAGKDVDFDGLGDTKIPYNSSGNITHGGDYLPLTAVSGPTFSITGMKFYDLNNNSQKDPGEPGLANWEINLKGNDTVTGKIVNLTTKTDTSGNYTFTKLRSGNYILQEIQQPGWTQTYPGWEPIFQQKYSIGVQRRGDIEDIVINDLDFGNFKPTAGSISGYKINDVNGNGRWDPGEKGLSGWIIKLYGVADSGADTKEVRKETITDAQGFYRFDDLPAGSYTITENVKSDFVPIGPVVKTVQLAKNQNSMNNNFTNRPVRG